MQRTIEGQSTPTTAPTSSHTDAATSPYLAPVWNYRSPTKAPMGLYGGVND